MNTNTNNSSTSTAAATGATNNIVAPPLATDTNGTLDIQEWHELDLSEPLLRGIYAKGFEHPSPIQRQAVKPIMQGRDLLAQAQSGTGKTATFTIGALYRVKPEVNHTQICIIAPTRELAQQTHSTVVSLGQFIPGLRIALYVGGTGHSNSGYGGGGSNSGYGGGGGSGYGSKPLLRRGQQGPQIIQGPPHIIIGCPGKIGDMSDRKQLSLQHITMLIIDEADAMIDRFSDQLAGLLAVIPTNAQMVLFSATMPPNIRQQTNQLLNDPVVITVQPDKVTLDGISQFYIPTEDDHHKYETVTAIFQHRSVSQCIIYCNSLQRVNTLYNSLCDDGFPVGHIHRDMDRHDRDLEFKRFVNGETRILVSSDLTARGIDVQQVGLVINFDVPKDVSTYVHRIGRSGRWGRKGLAINLISRRDINYMRNIEQTHKCYIKEVNWDELAKIL